MNLEMITEGLKQLLQENNYSSATIRFYEGEWNKIQCFLTEEYGNTEYDMERGLKYLEKQYGFITKYNNGTLSQSPIAPCCAYAGRLPFASGAYQKILCRKKSYYAECVLFKFIYGLFRLSEFYGTVSKYNRTL